MQALAKTFTAKPNSSKTMFAKDAQSVNLKLVMAAIAEKIPADAFKSWIFPCNVFVSEKILHIRARNQFAADFIKSVYIGVLESAAHQFDLRLEIGAGTAKANVAASTANDNNAQKFVPVADDVPVCAFDSFIASDANAFVVSACKKMAAGSANFSPLFIYGPSGCGKSVLAGCINTAAAGRTLIMTGTRFVSEFARALREHNIFAFKDFCRSADTFIMDDVHTLAGKKATTEEFVQLMTDLRAANKNIILTSNAAPNNLTGFDRRAVALMASGLVADIAAPDINTRKQILSCGGIDAKLAETLAPRVAADGHIIAGVVKKINAYRDLMDTDVSIDIAERLLTDVLHKAKTPLAAMKSMCVKLGVSYDDVVSKSRHATIVRARQIIMTALKSATNLSLAEIGRICGDRNHATVLYAISQTAKMRESDLIIGAQIDQMIQECKV